MKRVLIISLEYPPQVGGIATYVHSLARALDSKQTVVLTSHMRGEKQWDEQCGYKVIRKGLLYPKFLWPRWIRLFWHVLVLIRREKIEVLLIHHALPVGYVGWIIKKLFKLPYLIFSHGTDVEVAFARPWKAKMMRVVCNSAQQVITNSESLKKRLLRVLPELSEKTIVVYPSPDKDFFIPASFDVQEKLRSQYALEGKQIILSVGRLDEGKGFPHLIRMMPEILKYAPYLVWIIIGDGPKREEIFSSIQKNNLQNVVRFIGEIPHEHLKAFYYIADLFVLLTHPDEGREEGLGMVFLEAAACGLPAVAVLKRQ